MKRQNIKRTALLAALSVSIIIFGAIVFTPHENDDTFVEIKPIFTPEVVHMELPIPLSSPVATLRPIPMSETIESPAPSPPAAPSPKQEGECFFTLDILNDTISVAYGVEESTLKKTPGWLTTSVLPGESGMCVVYGHRNRNHLKVLEKVEPRRFPFPPRWTKARSTRTPFRTSQFTKVPTICGFLLWMAKRLCW